MLLFRHGENNKTPLSAGTIYKKGILTREITPALHQSNNNWRE
jgi:hypothetical protein